MSYLGQLTRDQAIQITQLQQELAEAYALIAQLEVEWEWKERIDGICARALQEARR